MRLLGLYRILDSPRAVVLASSCVACRSCQSILQRHTHSSSSTDRQHHLSSSDPVLDPTASSAAVTVHCDSTCRYHHPLQRRALHHSAHRTRCDSKKRATCMLAKPLVTPRVRRHVCSTLASCSSRIVSCVALNGIVILLFFFSLLCA